MLHSIILLPQALPQNNQSIEWYMLKVLFDRIMINGVLLVDNNKAILSDIKIRIQKHAPDILCDELLKAVEYLEKPEQGRVVVIHDWNIHTGDLLKESFKRDNNVIFYKVKSADQQIQCDLIITGSNFGVAVDGKMTISSSAPRGAKELDDRHRSNVTLSTGISSKQMREISINSYVLGDKNDSFVLQKVFYPIFAQSNYIDIYDRLIGSSFDRFTHNAVDIKWNFRDGLKQLIYLYCKYSEKNSLCFNIYTEVDNGINPESVVDLLHELYSVGKKQLESAGSKSKKTLTIKLYKSVKNPARMRHNRYIGTSQIVISIDKGADVVQENVINPSDYAVVTPREQFNKYITTGWSLWLSIAGDGGLRHHGPSAMEQVSSRAFEAAVAH